MGFETPPEKLYQPWSCHPAEPPVPLLRQSRALRLLLPRGPAPGNAVLWAQLLYFSGHCCYAWLFPSQKAVMELSNAATCAPPNPTGLWLNWTGFLLICLPNWRDAQKSYPKSQVVGWSSSKECRGCLRTQCSMILFHCQKPIYCPVDFNKIGLELHKYLIKKKIQSWKSQLKSPR